MLHSDLKAMRADLEMMKIMDKHRTKLAEVLQDTITNLRKCVFGGNEEVRVAQSISGDGLEVLEEHVFDDLMKTELDESQLDIVAMDELMNQQLMSQLRSPPPLRTKFSLSFSSTVEDAPAELIVCETSCFEWRTRQSWTSTWWK